VSVAGSSDSFDRVFDRVADKPRYSQAEWGYVELDPRTGQRTRALQPGRAFTPGSVAKIFVVSTAWNRLGPAHRFETPIYALGERDGATLNGDLVLEASGDLTLGGRLKADGEIAYTDVDHTYADSVPGATITSQDPLAGLDDLAQQVRATGITHVAGNVAIDNRLWKPDAALTEEDPGTNPILVNENVVDVQVRPTESGEPAQFVWRPQTEAIRVESEVTTSEKANDPDAQPFGWHLEPHGEGRVLATGSIPKNADPQLQVWQIPDPAAFARTALIESLGRAGVTVGAPGIAENPDGLLPDRNSYPADDQVAVLRSPPFREYARLILKVSHNVGAQVALCLLAADAGYHDCQRGFGVERDFLKRIGVNVREVALSDGRGGAPYNRLTPRATVQLLHWWTKRPDFETFKRSLPILGVDGDLALSGTNSPARGKVFAKTGAAAGPDSVNNQLVLGGKTIAGYLAGRGGTARPFALFMNNAFFPNEPGNIFVASADLSRIAAAMQQDAP
jgi:serine-type D-Ala-D-Ala carboxypeptidase/endopeptidase (penicillin-binding protein 4)